MDQAAEKEKDKINYQVAIQKVSPAPVQKITTQSPEIRVLLMNSDYSSYEHERVTGICNGKEFDYSADSPQLDEEEILLKGDEEGITVTSIDRQCGHPVYYGTLEIRKTKDSLNLVNEICLEDYLKAVVPSEMPSSYEEQALMAQAVCARTYAWKHIQDPDKEMKAYYADVDDSVNYQVYGNIFPQEVTDRAVLCTKGRILTQNGEPVQAYYFSTSAGFTSTDEIWGADEASSYLKSIRCDFDQDSPWRKWQVTIPWENIQKRAQELYENTGKLLSVDVARKNESGAVVSLQAVTEGKTFYINGEYSVRQFLSPEGCTIYEKDNAKEQGGKLLPSSYFTLNSSPGSCLEICGGGYGHGVGMSQNGANEMAKQGYTYEEILQYFFRNVQVEKIY
ncbi:MAG: SpoIID/LytB domain-containing protein [Blautia sp.]|nr:SpoIID/LytB domain-containing protein [Blautia sp.]